MKTSLRHIKAIFIKELQDYRRNPITLVIMNASFIFFLIIYVISIVKHGTNHISYIAVGLALTLNISYSCTILPPMRIMEERERRTLDVLMLSGVSSMEFLIGENLPVVCITMLTSAIMLSIFKFSFLNLILLCLIVFIIIISEVILMTLIGIIADNSTQSVMYTIPSVLILLVFPLFSFAETSYAINKFINVSNMDFIIKNIVNGNRFFYSSYPFLIIAVWLFVPLVLFILIYKTKKLY